MSWIGFFISFVSTFAAAPMVAIIREDLELTKPDLGSAGLAAVTGTIAARVVMGSICDVVGPRYGLSIVLMVTAPFCFCMSYVTSAAGFLICRMGIGLVPMRLATLGIYPEFGTLLALRRDRELQCAARAPCGHAPSPPSARP